MRAVVPTQRTYALLVLGGVVATLLANFSGPDPGLRGVVWGLLGFDGGLLLVALADGGWAWRRRVSAQRQPLPRLSIGRNNPVKIDLQAQKAAQKTATVLVYDRYPVSFEGPELPLAATVKAGSAQTLHYEVHPQQRGEYAWGDLELRQQGPLGLAWVEWRLPASDKVAVYPDLMGLRQLSVRLSLQATGTLQQKRRLGVGTEFAELREYAVGDDPRLIDWKATARHSAPLLRVLEPEREQTLIVLLDRGRLMTAQVQGLTRFDWGLNAALSLALAGLHRGDRVGMAVFDRNLHAWLPPKAGRSHLRSMVEQLTPMQPVLLESDYLGAVTQVVSQQHRRALVVMLTDIVDAIASAELLQALVRLRPRYLPFCVTLRDPQVDQLAETDQSEVDGAYVKAVALDLQAQRQAVFSRLQQGGVMVLDAPANQITEPLVEAYLRTKTRGRL